MNGAEIGTSHSSEWLFAVVASGLLIVWALHNAHRLFQVLRKPRLSLVAAVTEIRKYPSATEFAANYEDIDAFFLADPLLSDPWREFTETLLLPDETNANVRNTARPELYLNGHAVLSNRINLSHFKAMPNYLVGGGLLFTFIGLVWALYSAGKGVAANDVKEAQRHLQVLLQAATFKFASSIAGLGSSLLFSFGKKRWLHEIDHLCADLAQELERRLHFVTPSSLAHQSHRELQAQTTQLEKFNTDLAFSIAEALDQRIGQSMSAAVAPMIEALQKMSTNIGEINQHALEQMMQDFSAGIQGAAGQEMRALADTLGATQESLRALTADVGRIGERLGQDVEEGGRQFRSTMEEATTAIGGALRAAGDGLGEKLAETSAAFAERMEAAGEGVGDRIERAAAATESRLIDAGQAVEAALMAAGQSVGTRLESAAATAEARLKDGGLAVETALVAAGENLDAMFVAACGRFDQTVTTGMERVAATLTPITDRLASLDGTLATMGEGLARHQTAFATTLDGLQATLRLLRDTAEQLGESARPLQVSTERLGATAATLTELGGRFGETLVGLQGLNTALTTVAEEVRGAWTSTNERFEALDGDLERVFSELRAGLEAYTRQVSTFVTDVDSKMGQAITQLGGAIRELAEVAEEFKAEPQPT